MKLIVGLGNPGYRYHLTPHNLGFMAVDRLAEDCGVEIGKRENQALTAATEVEGERVVLAKPQTYMNLSGEAVRALVDFYKIPLENLLVISDDMDIPLGTLRIRQKGGAGGQKGLKSIMEHLGTQEFARLRVGIGRPPGRMDPMDYVLEDFESADHILVIETLDRVVKSIDTWLRFGLAIMMTRHNGTADESARNAGSLPESLPESPTE